VNRRRAGESLPTPDRDIDQARLAFERVDPTARALARHDAGAQPAESVEHDLAATG